MMLVISGSFPKSGSAWLLNLINDLMATAGYSDTRWVRNTFGLDFIKYDSCNIQEPTKEKLTILTSPPVSSYSFVVKTHFPPDPQDLALMAKGKIKVAFIYRDPRDTAVSALEAGGKLRERGIFKYFGEINTMKDAILWMHRKLRDDWERWNNIEGIIRLKYEDMLLDTMAELRQLCECLEIPVKEETMKRIIDKHSAQRLKNAAEYSHSRPFHFNKGIPGRFKELMTGEEIQWCRQIFGAYLDKMGYPG